MIKLYAVILTVWGNQNVQKGEPYTLTIMDIEAKETDKNYTFEGRRLAKEKVGKLENLYDSHSLIGFRMFVTEDLLEEAKQKVVLALQEHVDERIRDYQKLKEMVKAEPFVQYEKWSRN